MDHRGATFEPALVGLSVVRAAPPLFSWVGLSLEERAPPKFAMRTRSNIPVSTPAATVRRDFHQDAARRRGGVSGSGLRAEGSVGSTTFVQTCLASSSGGARGIRRVLRQPGQVVLRPPEFAGAHRAD